MLGSYIGSWYFFGFFFPPEQHFYLKKITTKTKYCGLRPWTDSNHNIKLIGMYEDLFEVKHSHLEIVLPLLWVELLQADDKRGIPDLKCWLSVFKQMDEACFPSCVLSVNSFMRSSILSACLSLDLGIMHHSVRKSARLPLLRVSLPVLGLGRCLFPGTSQG